MRQRINPARLLPVQVGAMSQLFDDARIAVRRLWHEPGFALVAVLTLALGLGANVAVFALVHGLLLRSLPVERPGELYRLGDNNNCCVNSGLQTNGYSLFSTRLYEHLRDRTTGELQAIAGFQATVQALGVRRAGTAGNQSVAGQYVTASYFSMFGIRPAAGRLFVPDDDRRDTPEVAVMSHQTWTQMYGQDPSVVGATFIVNGRPMTIVGVSAEGFFGDAVRPNPAGIWLPLGKEPAHRGLTSLAERAESDWLYAIGRLRPEATPERLAAVASTALQNWLDAQPFVSAANRPQIKDLRINVVPAGGGVALLGYQFGRALTILFVTSGLVLLIAAANLANLLLARADRGQAAIRAALGASPGRLMRLAMTEGIVVALVGGAVAIFIASGSAQALVGLAFPGVAFLPFDATPSTMILLFAIGLAVLTGALFTAAPAWAMSRTPPLEALAGVGRSGQARSFVPRRSLVVTQVALSLVLLVGAGLLATSLGNLQRQPLGFDPIDRTIVRIDPPPLADQPERLRAIYVAMRERLLRVPGVTEATYALYSPMEGNNWSSGISIAGRPVDPSNPDGASWNRVGPRYFETVGTRLLRGRLLNDSDTPAAARVVVVNDAFRRRFFEKVEPLGQRLGIGDQSHANDFEIVGVVDDVKYTSPTQPTRPMIFLPAFQTVSYANAGDRNTQARSGLMRTLIVRTSSGSGTLEGEIRRALAEVEPDLTIIRVLPHVDQVSGNFRIQRLMATLTSVYGLLALALASLGLYGVTAYGVAQRTREIGVRMALGADRGRIVRTVLRGPVVQTLVGLTIGVPLALGGGRLITTQLYEVDRADPTVLSGAPLVLMVATIVAAVLPALRAARTDPTKALRGQ
jgi:predicted permease